MPTYIFLLVKHGGAERMLKPGVGGGGKNVVDQSGLLNTPKPLHYRAIYNGDLLLREQKIP